MIDKKILVTGGAGFIGSNLTRELSKENIVTVIDDLSSGHLGNIKYLIDGNKINFIKGSITDIDLLKKSTKDIDYIFHLAAIASIPKSIKDPVTTHKVNVNGLFNVLTSAKDNNVKKVVFSSSCAIYGNPSKCPIDENTEPNPLSPYSTSKLIGEKYCNLFKEVYDLQTVSLRYFNVYGPRQDPLGDYAAVIPKFISLTLEDKPLIIYGTGEQTRDFIFVKDVVKANILLAENKVSGVFNVGSGKKTSIKDLAESILEISNKDLEIKYQHERPGDIIDSYADISKFKKLDFNTEYNLDEGLKETYNWFNK